MKPTLITCAEADLLRPGLAPSSSITNWVGGEVLNPELPSITATTWADPDGAEVLREELDAKGCRHWLLSMGSPR